MMDWAQLLNEGASWTPSSLEELEARLPGSLRLPLDPWARLLLAGYCRHLPRQRWVGKIVVDKLGGNLGQLSEWGALGHPRTRPQTGLVPGQREWRYFFHGGGCCLTHADGTLIDVNFYDGSADWIDPYFYQVYLASLTQPAPIEAALRGRQKNHRGWWLVDERTLQESQLLPELPQGRVLGEALTPLLVEREKSDSALRRAWLSVGLEDYDAARDALAALGEVGTVTERARKQVERRVNQYCESNLFEVEPLEHLGRERVVPLLARRLEAHVVDQSTAKVVRILIDWGQEPEASLLVDLAQRASEQEPPCHEVTVSLSTLLLAAPLRGGQRVDVEQARRLANALARPEPWSASADALLALLDAKRGCARLARLLTSADSKQRKEAANALLILGMLEAVEVLEASDAAEAKQAFDEGALVLRSARLRTRGQPLALRLRPLVEGGEGAEDTPRAERIDALLVALSALSCFEFSGRTFLVNYRDRLLELCALPARAKIPFEMAHLLWQHTAQSGDYPNALQMERFVEWGLLEQVTGRFAVWKWIWRKADESDTPRLFRLDPSLRRALLDRVGARYEKELRRLVVGACNRGSRAE